GRLCNLDAAVSVREAEVLALLGEHLTHSEIAGRLFLSVRTVESHVASLRRKLAIPGHRELVRYAAAQRGATPAPLPLPLTSFVGRARELSDLAGRLLAHRLVSVVGPGGAGKTRLAQTVMSHVQDRFAGRVSYVDLVPVSEPAGVPAAVAEACGVADLPGRDTIAALLRGLGEQPTLLVLDNCEHVVNAVALLVESLVSGCPLLHVLVTSRARLVLPFEQVFTLGGLSAGGDAVELFVQRAVSAGWQAPDGAQLARIGEVCRSLDGLALAIELAAVRVPALGLEGVERGLGDHEALLVSGPRVGHRHRSMHDTLEWSFRLLAPAEQAVLCRVSVFAAGFTVDAATSVAAYGGVRTADVRAALGRLVDQSLVVPVASMPDRWRLLEPVRQYAGARMDADDATAYAMHLDWADREARHLTTLSERPGRTWQGPLDEVVDDLRSALEWAAHQDLHHEEATALADRLATLLFRSGRTREAQARYEQAARLATDPRTEGEALERAVAVARSRVLGEEALRLGLAAVQARRRQADEDALGDSRPRWPRRSCASRACSPVRCRQGWRRSCSTRSRPSPAAIRRRGPRLSSPGRTASTRPTRRAHRSPVRSPSGWPSPRTAEVTGSARAPPSTS
ncbi:MAG: hypothetical protein QOJ60_3205, partial [Actinomycetota bacterium]|nr:hypothetical protein [Actinomycetota bacterium]